MITITAIVMKGAAVIIFVWPMIWSLLPFSLAVPSNDDDNHVDARKMERGKPHIIVIEMVIIFFSFFPENWQHHRHLFCLIRMPEWYGVCNISGGSNIVPSSPLPCLLVLCCCFLMMFDSPPLIPLISDVCDPDDVEWLLYGYIRERQNSSSISIPSSSHLFIRMDPRIESEERKKDRRWYQRTWRGSQHLSMIPPDPWSSSWREEEPEFASRFIPTHRLIMSDAATSAILHLLHFVYVSTLSSHMNQWENEIFLLVDFLFLSLQVFHSSSSSCISRF